MEDLVKKIIESEDMNNYIVSSVKSSVNDVVRSTVQNYRKQIEDKAKELMTNGYKEEIASFDYKGTLSGYISNGVREFLKSNTDYDMSKHFDSFMGKFGNLIDQEMYRYIEQELTQKIKDKIQSLIVIDGRNMPDY